MKKITIYMIALLVALSMTGCFAQATVAKNDLHSVKTESDATASSNNEGTNAANGEIKEINNESYKGLVTPKW